MCIFLREERGNRDTNNKKEDIEMEKEFKVTIPKVKEALGPVEL